MIVKAPASKLSNPDRLAPLFRVSKLPVPWEATVNAPVPDRVPFRTMSAVVPDPIVGLLPSGKLQSLLIVLVALVCAITTEAKTVLLHESTAVTLPSKVTVPPLALKVVPEFRVNDAPKLMLPVGAVKTPLELKVKAPLKSAVV